MALFLLLEATCQAGPRVSGNFGASWAFSASLPPGAQTAYEAFAKDTTESITAKEWATDHFANFSSRGEWVASLR